MTSRYRDGGGGRLGRVHSRLPHRGAWLEHDGPLPVIDGTLIRLQVDHLLGDRGSQAGLAVVVSRKRAALGRGPLLAGVLAPLRPGAHLPAVQAKVAGGTKASRGIPGGANPRCFPVGGHGTDGCAGSGSGRLARLSPRDG